MNPNTVEVARPSKGGMRSRFSRLIPIGLFCLLLALGAVPHYLSGQWPWAKPLPVENLKQLRQLPKTGLTVSGWKTVQQQEVAIGGHKWSAQLLQPEGKSERQKPILLLVRPQNDPKGQPEIEWVDLKGLDRWSTDSRRTIKFTRQGRVSQVPVEANFFRAWNDRQTYAVAQWYAWPDGGHPAPAVWFAADQAAQLRGQRQAWIALNVQMPIAPLAEIAPVQGEMEALVKQVHESAIAALGGEQKQK